MRLRLQVRDRSGHELPVAFYPESGERPSPEQFKKGYPHQHYFLDMTIGIRQEDMNLIQVRPQRLEQYSADSLGYSMSTGGCHQTQRHNCFTTGMLSNLQTTRKVAIQMRRLRTALVLWQGAYQTFSAETWLAHKYEGLSEDRLDSTRPQSQLQRVQNGSTSVDTGLAVARRLSLFSSIGNVLASVHHATRTLPLSVSPLPRRNTEVSHTCVQSRRDVPLN